MDELSEERLGSGNAEKRNDPDGNSDSSPKQLELSDGRAAVKLPATGPAGGAVENPLTEWHEGSPYETIVCNGKAVGSEMQPERVPKAAPQKKKDVQEREAPKQASVTALGEARKKREDSPSDYRCKQSLVEAGEQDVEGVVVCESAHSRVTCAKSPSSEDD